MINRFTKIPYEESFSIIQVRNSFCLRKYIMTSNFHTEFNKYNRNDVITICDELFIENGFKVDSSLQSELQNLEVTEKN